MTNLLHMGALNSPHVRQAKPAACGALPGVRRKVALVKPLEEGALVDENPSARPLNDAVEASRLCMKD